MTAPDTEQALRILLLNDRIPPENRGGAGAVVWRLGQGLQQAGHDVHVAAATPDAPFQEVREGIPTYHVHVRYPHRWRAWLSLYNPQVNGALRALYAQIKPDVINAHNIHMDLTYHSLTIARQMDIATVFSSHDVMPFAYHKLSHFIKPDGTGITQPADYRLPIGYNVRQMRLRYNPLRNLMIRRVLARHAQIRTAPSQALSDAHRSNDLPPFVTVHNGIDPSQFTATDEDVGSLRNQLNLHGRRVILFAGRLTPAKGTAQLLTALEQVVQSIPETLLLVLSSVPIAEQLTDPRYDNLRDQHIRSGGWLTGRQLAAAFHAVDLIVAPSVIFDTFPTVNLEAMAARKPVVTSTYGGAQEAVIDGETGYIINPYDTQQFADRLLRLLGDEHLRQQMGQAAYARVMSHFHLRQQVSAMIEHYHTARTQIIPEQQ